MRIPGRKFLVKSFRWARSRVGPGLMVLGYHRLGPPADDAFDLSVSPSDFAGHLSTLATRARVLPLRDAVRDMERGMLPPRAVVVTFDDGYDDTLTRVLPLLEQAGIPATVFVAGGAGGAQFWWDELAQLLMESPELPPRLSLEIRGARRTWLMPEGRHTAAQTNSNRLGVLRSVAAALMVLSSAERARQMSALHAWCPPSAPRTPRFRSLTADDIRRLAASPMIEIGAHTMSHPLLTALTADEQAVEIARSRTELEHITGAPVTSFAYPHGAYSPAVVTAVRRAGFTVACCSVPDVATRRSSTMALPRFWNAPRDPDRFAAWLDRWLVG